MARRTHLLNIERNIQNIWLEQCFFQKEITDTNETKFMGNFPYPYMNGLLHIGHAFTLSKLDFLTRYKNMVCDNVLLPFSFHCTGTPIVVCADKLKNEFNKETIIKKSEIINEDKSNITVFRSNKSKSQSKTGKENTQTDIMKQMDIPDEDIYLFQNPEYWCNYFPKKAIEDLKLFGLCCDWRRSFITTKINPYYDKFIKWQFNKLYKKKLIYYGRRISVFSRVNNQACADHERSEGEGVKCQEYTLIKIYIKNKEAFYNIFINNINNFNIEENFKNEILNFEFFKKKNIILLGGTLKPETAYGQNYTFINPNEFYYLTFGFTKQALNFGGKNYVNNIMSKKEILNNCENIYICSENSLYNLAYQGIIPLLKCGVDNSNEHIKINDYNCDKDMKINYKDNLDDLFILNKMKGELFIGLECYTNLALIKNLYILPMTTIKMNISTGIVPCVSSDSVDDYACLEEIKRKKKYYCEKYNNLKEDYLYNESYSCIELPSVGYNTGKYFYEYEKITSYKDSKLQKIKDFLYKKQFFEGIIRIEEYSGMKTQKYRKLIKKIIETNNEGFIYNEPESLVRDRNNVKCIAALCNQWYINYGNIEFKKDVLIQLKKHNFQTYNDVLYKQLQHVIFWLDDWSCSRAYGLGTNMPKFDVEIEKNKQQKQEKEKEYNIDNNTNANINNKIDDKINESFNHLKVEKNKQNINTENKIEEELIESLSDSTIYMAYYTISHFLQGSLDGKVKGILDIDVDDINDEFFDYVFDISDDTSQISKNITKEKLNIMRKEFTYWYPFDLRVSGKDLIFNHLTMSLFNHVAIWGKKIYSRDYNENKNILEKQNEILNEIDNLDLDQYETIKYFPKSFFCNGHILVNKEKMSKSKGNFITLNKCISLYSSDGTRIALADAGDTIEDANFNTDTANSAIMKLYNLINFCIETKNNVYIFRCGEKTFNDLIFENEINYLTMKCKESYEKLLFRDVLKYGFYDMLLKRDTYRQMCDKIHMHKESVNFFIERICIIINPIIPHVTEHIWTYILKKNKYLFEQKWPNSEDMAFSIVMHKQYINILNLVENFRKSYEKVIKKGKFKMKNNKKESTDLNEIIEQKEANKIEKKELEELLENENEDDDEDKEETNYKAIVYVATEYNNIQKKIIEILNKIINQSKDGKLPNDFINLIVKDDYVKKISKNEKKDILGFATFLVKDNVTLNNNQYELTLPYDEMQLIKKNVDFIKRSLNLSDIQVFEKTKQYEFDDTDISSQANPGNPSIFLYKIKEKNA